MRPTFKWGARWRRKFGPIVVNGSHRRITSWGVKLGAISWNSRTDKARWDTPGIGGATIAEDVTGRRSRGRRAPRRSSRGDDPGAAERDHDRRRGRRLLRWFVAVAVLLLVAWLLVYQVVIPVMDSIVNGATDWLDARFPTTGR